MDPHQELRLILKRLRDVYGSGDVEGYLSYYAPDMKSCFEGVISDYEEACCFIRSLFAGGGRTLEFSSGDRTQITFSEKSDAAVLSYPWREKFQYADGRVTDGEYFQTEVWLLRNGEWKISHVHLTTLREHSSVS